ncbi:MAG: right-handed parallel beta-helix repeat-containing protein [Nanoarchaeota archaeon]
MRKRLNKRKAISMGLSTALFVLLFLILFIPEGKSNPDTGVTNCTNLTIAGERYNLTNDIYNNQIADACINIFSPNVTFNCNGHYIYSIQNYSGVYVNATNATIKNCNITMGSGGNANAYGIYLNGAKNGTIFNNSIFGDSYAGIYLQSSSNNNLTNNNATSNSSYGIYLYSSSNNTLTSNNGISNATHGIYTVYSSNTILTSNIGISNLGNGIFIRFSSNNTLTSNTGISNLTYGISIQYYSNNTLNNSISNNNKYGLYISNSNGTIVTNLTAKNNSLYGIFLESGSSNNIIKNSFIQLNNGSAFSLNNTGTALSNNYFYNNYFNNSLQYSNISTSSVNFFNITKTAGVNIVGGTYLAGNYWAAPNGSGFSQTCTASTDGICDTSYNFDGINYDYLPLTCIESWSCGAWGTCSYGKQGRTCKDVNLCQTYKYRPVIVQSCSEVFSSSSQQGGSSASVSQSFIEISPSKPAEMLISNSEMDLTSIVLNVNETIVNSSITIKSQTNNTNLKIGLPTGRIYQAFEVTAKGINNQNIINSTFNFKINKTWLLENNITIHFKKDSYWLIENGIVGNIKLYRLPTGVSDWVPLTTSFSKQDEKYYYFYSISPGFSTFVVFFNKYDCLPGFARCSGTQVQLCLGNATWLTTEQCSYSCKDGICSSASFTNMFVTIVEVIIIGAIIIYLILTNYKRKKKK